MKKSVVAKKQNLSTLIAVIVFLIGLFASVIYQKYLTKDIVFTAPLDNSCELHLNECTSQLQDNGSVTFKISPNPIPILKPLLLGLVVKNLQVENVTVNFIGLNMDMGYNVAKLIELSRDNGDIQFGGEFIIPICIKDKMQWEARVYLDSDQGKIMVPFRFTTTK